MNTTLRAGLVNKFSKSSYSEKKLQWQDNEFFGKQTMSFLIKKIVV